LNQSLEVMVHVSWYKNFECLLSEQLNPTLKRELQRIRTEHYDWVEKLQSLGVNSDTILLPGLSRIVITYRRHPNLSVCDSTRMVTRKVSLQTRLTDLHQLVCCRYMGDIHLPEPPEKIVVVYYESMKRKLKIKPIYECRCNGRLQTKRFTRLSHTGLVVELEHLKMKTRLTNEKFASVKGECEI
jgi:hypothetical protein